MFTRARLSDVGFIQDLVVLLGRALCSSGSFKMELFHSGDPRGRRVHSCPRGFTRARLVFVVDVRVGSLGSAYGLLGSFDVRVS